MTKIELLLHYAAHEDMGIYPSATHKPNGVIEHRTPWQDGWNAAVMKKTEKWCILSDWFRKLPAATAKVFEAMLDADIIKIAVRKEEVHLWISMSDTFHWACADSEEVLLDELPRIASIYGDFGHDGLTAWAAKKRDMEPLESLRTEVYLKAKEAMQSTPPPAR